MISYVWLESESKHVDFCVGWRISNHKLLDFDTLCKVLGVQLGLKQSGDGPCLITNTEERVAGLVKELDDALKFNALAKSEGEKLRGRPQFASSQVFGFSEESLGG